MKPQHQRTGTSFSKPVIERIEKLHPYKTFSFLILSVVCLVYATLIGFFVKYLVFENQNINFHLPKFFTISTLILLGSMFFVANIPKDYKNEQITQIRKRLSWSLTTGLLFFISQSLAWIEILNHLTKVELNQTASYVFVFSAVHLIMVLASLIIAGVLFYKYIIIENDPIKTLIVTTNPVEKVKLDILVNFWYYNTISWIAIFIMFLFIF